MAEPVTAFEARPNRTLVQLSVPVLFSLVAEPLTGLVDTAFVARLGADELAGLGVGAIALSSFFWIFNFLGIGTQTAVAQASGASQRDRAASLAALSIRVGLGVGLVVGTVGVVLTRPIAVVMGAEDAIMDAAVSYMRIRFLGVPAMLAMLGAFGALRGLQDMRSPLWVAVGLNLLNMALDPVLMFGVGPLPELGIAGAAAASSISQWAGAASTFVVVRRRLGPPGSVHAADIRRLGRSGADIVVRTGLLTLFLVLATRAATRLGAEAGAAHQAIRQVWVFTALFLDAWAISAQSLVGYYAGAGRLAVARRVAAYASWWSLATGAALAAALWLATPAVTRLLVPEAADGFFARAWWLALLSLPVGALTFATDGIHWGTGDFSYLRNAVLVATLVSASALFVIEAGGGMTLAAVWGITAIWVGLRAALGLVRIWPGAAKAPLGRWAQDTSRSSSSA